MSGYEFGASFQCKRCGWQSEWLCFDNVTEIRRGIPCPKCNREQKANLKMHKIALTKGTADGDDPNHAFDPKLMDAAGMDSATLVQALAHRLRPFAMLLRPGCGVAVIIEPDGEGTVTGVAVETPAE